MKKSVYKKLKEAAERLSLPEGYNLYWAFVDQGSGTFSNYSVKLPGKNVAFPVKGRIDRNMDLTDDKSITVEMWAEGFFLSMVFDKNGFSRIHRITSEPEISKYVPKWVSSGLRSAYHRYQHDFSVPLEKHILKLVRERLGLKTRQQKTLKE